MNTTKSLLILDDSKMMWTIYKTLLKGLPVAIDFAATAEEAAALIRQRATQGGRYDLVISDLNCPGFGPQATASEKGGFDLLAMLKGDERLPQAAARAQGLPVTALKVPVIVMTADDDPAVLRTAMGAGQRAKGADVVLTKEAYLKMNSQATLQEVVRGYLH